MSDIQQPDLLPQKVHEVVDEESEARLFEELDDDAVLRDGDRNVWLLFGDDYGDFYVVRPRSEDDPMPDVDLNRPVGPESLEGLPYPWLVMWPAVPYLAPDEARS